MLGEFSPVHLPPVGGEYYVFRDAVHNLIEIEQSEDGKYVRRLLRTPEVQRLRRIRQNGFGSFVYSSLETTRFPHALGSFHIAQRMAASLLERQPHSEDGFPICLQLSRRDCLAFSVAALLHDIGHGPLSHTWEECFSFSHEEIGHAILASPTTHIGRLLAERDLHPRYPDIGQDVLRLLSGQHHLDYLFPLLEGNLDVDRLDFIVRDSRAAGVTYGMHDLEWINRTFRFARLPATYVKGPNPKWIIAIDGRKGLSTLVQFLRARENMYRLVYHHKTTRAVTKMLVLLFKRARQLAHQDDFSCNSGPLRKCLALADNEAIPLDSFLRLDDSDIWMVIKGWAEDSPDRVLSDLSRRILSRDLFKVFLLSDQVYKRLCDIDSRDSGNVLSYRVKTRLGLKSLEDAAFYYGFDETTFDIIGRKQQPPWRSVWIMQTGALGWEFTSLRDFWNKEVGPRETEMQHLLIVHPDVVDNLAGIVERLSFPTESAKSMTVLPDAPPPYRTIAPIGAEGTWKEVYLGVNTDPGSSTENVVALKLYKSPDGAGQAIERDVRTINLTLESPHPNLSTPRWLRGSKEEMWILEPLWTGSLEDLALKQGPRRDLIEILDIARQLFAGLACLHREKLRHTDIKPANCGILHAPSNSRKYVLGDFGCLSTSPNDWPDDEKLLGTYRTRAPEVIQHVGISQKSDVWAMAATIYALCTMKYPFMPIGTPHRRDPERVERQIYIESNIEALLAEFRVGVGLVLPPIISEHLVGCFGEEQSRPSAEDIARAFDSSHGDLIKAETSGLSRTAWLRAEDIAIRYGAENRGTGTGALSDAERDEVKALTKTFTSYIPKTLAESLARLIPT